MITIGRPPKEEGVCGKCRFAKQQFKESCYCVKYGITIGYYKVRCEGFENDAIEIWKREDYD